MSTTAWHESWELIDDGPDAETIALDDWAEQQLATLPALAECDFCAGDALTPFGPIVEGVPDGCTVHRRGEWRYACDGCLDDAIEDGWRRD